MVVSVVLFDVFVVVLAVCCCFYGGVLSGGCGRAVAVKLWRWL